jgi:hypothetical protein
MGIDPGVSTGVAFAYYTNGAYEYTTNTATSVQEVWDQIAWPVKVLIVEEFNAQLISKYGIHTVEVVGGVIALAYKAGITVIRDTPQQRRPYIAYARAHVPPREHITVHEQRHEVDALSHVVRYLYAQGHITSLRVDNG